MGVVGIGKAMLKCGRVESVTPNDLPRKLAGGERLSGEALGGVSGAAYGIEMAGGALDMLMKETGVQTLI